MVVCEHFFRNKHGVPIDNGFKCNGTHGEIALDTALVKSCNIYFQTMMARFLDRKLLARHDELCRRFGFGERTGVEVERASYPTNRFDLFRKGTSWGERVQSAVGQGDAIRLSPAQVARAYAGLATGSVPELHLVARVGGRRTVPSSRPLGIPESALAPVRSALRDVPVRGTATGYRLAEFGVACKTGTAERGNDLANNAWLAGFAPARGNRPAIAFAMVVLNTPEHGADGCGPRLLQFLVSFYGEAHE
jgi:cell division protein FtsI/penicillin-binding protein 2